MVSDLDKAVLGPQGLPFPIPPLAWNCPVNELRGPLGLEGKDC